MKENLEEELDLFNAKSFKEKVDSDKNTKLFNGFVVSILIMLLGFDLIAQLEKRVSKLSYCELVSETSDIKEYSCNLISKVKIDKRTNSVYGTTKDNYKLPTPEVSLPMPIPPEDQTISIPPNPFATSEKIIKNENSNTISPRPDYQQMFKETPMPKLYLNLSKDVSIENGKANKASPNNKREVDKLNQNESGQLTNESDNLEKKSIIEEVK